MSSPDDALRMIDSDLAGRNALDVVAATLSAVRGREPSQLAPPPAIVEERLRAHHRVGPLVDRAWPTLADPVRQRRRTLAQLSLNATLYGVSEVLRSIQLDHIVLKGLATAQLDYPEPTMRQTGDVDLLVRLETFGDAVGLLLRNGYRRHVGQVADPILLKGTTLICPRGNEVDLHWRLSRYSVTSDSDELWSTGTHLPDGGRALSATARLVHAAVHSLESVNPRRRLSSVADITAILDNTGVDLADVRALSERLGVAPLCRAGLEIESLILGRQDSTTESWPHRRSVSSLAHVTCGRRLPLEHLAAVLALPDGARKRDYLAIWMHPARVTVDTHGGARGYLGSLFQQITGR